MSYIYVAIIICVALGVYTAYLFIKVVLSRNKKALKGLFYRSVFIKREIHYLKIKIWCNQIVKLEFSL